MGEKGTFGEQVMKHGLLPKSFNWNWSDSDHAFNEATGQNAVWDEGRGQWIDSKTGEGISPAAGGPPNSALSGIHGGWNE